jgi:hypothetical protein
MNVQPPKLERGKVICWAIVDSSVEPTENTRHFVDGAHVGPFPRLMVATFPGDDGYYLLYCDESWNEITDTWHASLEDAKRQAEFEYRGINSRWCELA